MFSALREIYDSSMAVKGCKEHGCKKKNDNNL